MPTGGPIRIVVCIKQVPKAQELQVDPKTQTLKRVGVPSEINPPDANALEFALRIKDDMPAEIVVLSMGPTSFAESLERAIAMGADRAVLLTVNFGCNRPREPTLRGKIRVKGGGVIVHWSGADVGIDRSKGGLKNSPTIVAKVDTVPLPPRARKLFQGEAREAAAQLLKAL